MGLLLKTTHSYPLLKRHMLNFGKEFFMSKNINVQYEFKFYLGLS